jgi:fructosamine-3-kinase
VNVLPDDVREALQARFGSVGAAEPLSGGDVARAARVATGQGTVFVKWKADAPPGFFALEADGLNRLRTAGALRVPEVLEIGDETPFLALEAIAVQPPNDERRFGRRLGEGLAALHRGNAAPDGLFGLDVDNYLGSQPQPNTPQADWWSFYRDCRLAPQIEKAKQRRLVPPERARLLGRVLEEIETLLDDFPAAAVLIHGDLWRGNILSAAGDEPILIDPAVYYGEREVEIAYTELFGGFPQDFLPAYHSAFPLDPGYERRRPLHQLYPLLVHLNHFGESYGPSVDLACRNYVW